MPGLPTSDMPLLSRYKSALPGEKTRILRDTANSIWRLPVYFEDEQHAATVYNSTLEAHQLLKYVSYTQLVETQHFFDISFDSSPLVERFGADNVFFEFNEQGQMRLKKQTLEIPHDIWVYIWATQQNLLEKDYEQLGSSLDPRSVFTPTSNTLPGEWKSDDLENLDHYEDTARLLNTFAQEVIESTEELGRIHRRAFLAATKELQKISRKYPDLKPILLNINQQAASLSEVEPMDTLIVAMTETASMLRGTTFIMHYEELLNNMNGHATLSSDMRGLFIAMLTLSALAVSLGIVAAAMPALGVATVVTAAIAGSVAGASATLFGAGAAYAFFAAEPGTEATGLSKAMADAVAARNALPGPVVTAAANLGMEEQPFGPTDAYYTGPAY